MFCKRNCRVGVVLGVICLVAAGFSGRLSAQDAKTAEAGKAGPAAGSSPQALAMYADAANYQNNSAFDLAAEEWARFLEAFPNDPLTPKAQQYLGVCQLQLKQYAKAAESFQKVVAKFPKFEQIEETYLNLGWCYYSLATAGDATQYPLAAATFNKLAADFPQGKNVDQALFFEAESLYALGKHKEAALVYGKLVTGHADSKLRADALCALGVTLEEMSEWVQANKAYDKFIEGFPRSDLLTEVRMRRAESILQQGQTEQAAQLFADVSNVEGFKAADHAVMRQAYCLAKLGKLTDAAALYASLAERFPESKYLSEATLSAGRCYYRADQDTEAAKWLTKIVETGGEPAAEAAHWLSRVHLRAKAPAEVPPLVDRVLPQAGASPYAANLRLDKADALYELPDRMADSLAEYLAVVSTYPEHEVAAAALYNAAFTALELKQHDKATELANQFLAKFAAHALAPDSRYILAECLVQKKDLPAADAAYRELIAAAADHPENKLWQVRLGLVVYLQKNYQAAIDLLTPLLAKLENPEQKAEAYYVIGLAHYQQGQFAEAIPQFQAAATTSATWRQADENALFLARAQFKSQQLHEALATLEGLIKAYPQTSLTDQVQYQLGECYYGLNQYAEAVAAYSKVIQGAPDSTYVPYALYGCGWAELKAEQFEPATAHFTTLLEKYPEHSLRAETLLARGMCHRQQQQLAEAIADIDQYVATNPPATQRADALYERGLAEAAKSDFVKAASTFAAILADQPDYPDSDKVLYELGWACRSVPDEGAAIKAFAALGDKYPASPLAAEAFFHVGEDHYTNARYADAVQAYQKSQQANNPALAEKVCYKLGWALYQLQQYPAALEQFEAQLKAHAEGPLASDAVFMKGECLFRMQDYQKALPVFVEALAKEPSSAQIAVLRQLHAGQAAIQLEKYNDAVGFLDALIEKFPQSKLLAEAHFERGRARHKLDQLDQAAADFTQATERSRDVVGTRAMFMLGEIEFQRKQYEQAIKNFQRVMFRYTAEQATPDIKIWQAKAGFEAGRCAEVLIESAPADKRAARIADAKKFYAYVVEKHADNEMAAEAKKRLDALAKLKS